MRIFGVPAPQAPAVCPQVLPYVQQALDYSHGWWTPEMILARVLDQRAQLFVGTPDDAPEKIVGAMVTEIQVNDIGHKGVNILALAADEFEPFAEQGHEMIRTSRYRLSLSDNCGWPWEYRIDCGGGCRCPSHISQHLPVRTVGTDVSGWGHVDSWRSERPQRTLHTD